MVYTPTGSIYQLKNVIFYPLLDVLQNGVCTKLLHALLIIVSLSKLQFSFPDMAFVFFRKGKGNRESVASSLFSGPYPASCLSPVPCAAIDARELSTKQTSGLQRSHPKLHEHPFNFRAAPNVLRPLRGISCIYSALICDLCKIVAGALGL